MTLKQQLKWRVASGQIGDVLKQLMQLNRNDNDVSNTCILQMGRWNSITTQTDKGLVVFEHATVEYNRIKDAVLRMIDDLED